MSAVRRILPARPRVAGFRQRTGELREQAVAWRARAVDRLRRAPEPFEVVNLIVLLAIIGFVFWQLQPSQLFRNTTPAGGDMGAHVWQPAYLRDHLLPHGRLTGWAPDWYAGFPTLVFYFPLPSFIIVLVSLVLPYGIAFKLVSVSGLLALPLAAFVFGRLSGLRDPGPACLAVGTLPFLFDRSFTIYGGNIPSTLAGEFAFSISLALALLFLGVVARGLENGRHRALAAVLLAATGLCHVIPTFFALTGAAVLILFRFSWARLRWAIPALATGGALAGFWVIPFLLRLPYTNDMGWEKIKAIQDTLLVNGKFTWVVVIAAIGGVTSLLQRHRTGIFLSVMAVLSWIGFATAPQGRLWNARLLPFWFLCIWLLAGLAVSEIAFFIATTIRMGRQPDPVSGGIGQPIEADGYGGAHVGAPSLAQRRLTRSSDDRVIAGVAAGFGRYFGVDPVIFRIIFVALTLLVGGGVIVYLLSWLLMPIDSDADAAAGVSSDEDAGGARIVLLLAPLFAVIVALGIVAFPLHRMPFGHTTAKGTYSWMGVETSDRSFVPDWVRWNYSGYESTLKPRHDEYFALMQTMTDVGQRTGCGRAMWEYEAELDGMGTPMAPMLMPYWTHGCIGSMEGLFFESSATTPYHFLNQSELSDRPSRAQRDLPYENVSVAAGVRHLQLLGVKYYMALSPDIQNVADHDSDLHLVATSGPWTVHYANGDQQRTWKIYEVAHAEEVAPLSFEPAVMQNLQKGAKPWLNASVAWYLDPSRWAVPLAASGPKEWPRVQIDAAQPAEHPVAPVTVSHIKITDDRISFDVDRVGRPVLVKMSYFPNWQASGAQGPWRVTPNQMVVIPTSRHVSLHYGYTPVDEIGWFITLFGLAGLVVLWLAGPVRYPDRRRRQGQREAVAASVPPPPPPSPTPYYADLDKELAGVGVDSTTYFDEEGG